METSREMAAVLLACCERPDDEASLAALADLLLECPAQERTEVLRRLARESWLAKEMRMSLHHRLVTQGGGKEVACEMALPPREESSLAAGYVLRELQHRVMNHLAGALDLERWYAIRLRYQEQTEPYYGPEQARWRERRVRLRAEVVPLDGGRIDLPEVG